jgi:hypothetical protein
MRIQRVSKWSKAEKVREGKYFFYTKANKKEVKKKRSKCCSRYPRRASVPWPSDY